MLIHTQNLIQSKLTCLIYNIYLKHCQVDRWLHRSSDDLPVVQRLPTKIMHIKLISQEKQSWNLHGK